MLCYAPPILVLNGKINMMSQCIIWRIFYFSTPLCTFYFSPWSDLHWSGAESRRWGCLSGWEWYALIRLRRALPSRMRHLHRKWRSKQDEFGVPWMALVRQLPSWCQGQFWSALKHLCTKIWRETQNYSVLKVKSSSFACRFAGCEKALNSEYLPSTSALALKKYSR